MLLSERALADSWPCRPAFKSISKARSRSRTIKNEKNKRKKIKINEMQSFWIDDYIYAPLVVNEVKIRYKRTV